MFLQIPESEPEQNLLISPQFITRLSVMVWAAKSKAAITCKLKIRLARRRDRHISQNGLHS